jgi:hypothetical protein
MYPQVQVRVAQYRPADQLQLQVRPGSREAVASMFGHVLYGHDQSENNYQCRRVWTGARSGTARCDDVRPLTGAWCTEESLSVAVVCGTSKNKLRIPGL